MQLLYLTLRLALMIYLNKWRVKLNAKISQFFEDNWAINVSEFREIRNLVASPTLNTQGWRLHWTLSSVTHFWSPKTELRLPFTGQATKTIRKTGSLSRMKTSDEKQEAKVRFAFEACMYCAREKIGEDRKILCCLMSLINIKVHWKWQVRWLAITWSQTRAPFPVSHPSPLPLPTCGDKLRLRASSSTSSASSSLSADPWVRYTSHFCRFVLVRD